MKIAEKSIWKYRIVYHESFWSKKCAERIRAAIASRAGVALQAVPDSAPEQKCEILVGATNRAESEELRKEYGRPNLYYTVKAVNSKLVCMGEGYKTLDRVAEILEKLIADSDNICGDIACGDLSLEPDASMSDRAENTDVRVLDWNMNAPDNMGANWMANAERAADVILRHMPDVIGTNELYNSRNCGAYKRFYDAVMNALSDHYTAIESSTYDEGQPTEGLVGDPARYGAPSQNIIIRKGAGITLLRSGYRYTPNLVAYHGYHWAMLETAEKKKFIFSVGHYEDCRRDPTCAVGHVETVNYAQSLSGESEALPAIITGDLFTHVGCTSGGYYEFIKAGYSDAQRDAKVNCNGDITFSTFHRPGRYQPRWVSIDLVFGNSGVEPLSFKVITSQEALDVSDHCPVCADLKLN